jgi:hypothetical protein
MNRRALGALGRKVKDCPKAAGGGAEFGAMF